MCFSFDISMLKLVWQFFFIIYWAGESLSPLGTSFTNWPILPAPDDRWWWMWSCRWNEDWQGKPKYSEKTCPSATLSITDPTRPDLRSNSGRRGGKPATNRLGYGTATLLSNFSFGAYCRTIRAVNDFQIWRVYLIYLISKQMAVLQLR
jgi:hypothetical protein